MPPHDADDPVIHSSEQGETVLVDGLRVQVRRSARRRTLGLTIERDGTVSAIAPTALPSAELVRVVETRRLWIQSALARRSAMVSSEQVAEPAYVSGESFPYLGRRYRLKLLPPGGLPVGAPALSLAGGRFLLRTEVRIKGAEIFRRWYAAHLELWLHARLGSWQRRVGIEIRRLGGDGTRQPLGVMFAGARSFECPLAGSSTPPAHHRLRHRA